MAGHSLSVLTYGISSIAGGYGPTTGGTYVEEPALPINTYTPITYTAVIAQGSAAIGQNIQLLIEQSRLDTASQFTYNIRVDDVSITFTPASSAVPEPTSMAIFGLGVLGLAYRKRRK